MGKLIPGGPASGPRGGGLGEIPIIRVRPIMTLQGPLEPQQHHPVTAVNIFPIFRKIIHHRSLSGNFHI